MLSAFYMVGNSFEYLDRFKKNYIINLVNKRIIKHIFVHGGLL